MTSKRAQEGYLLIDHRNSPGITPEFIRDHKLDAPAVGAGKVLETALTVCHCCGGDVILNPNRSRPREWCMKHDAYMCDNCAMLRKITGSCIPLKQRLFNIFEKISRAASHLGAV